MKKFNLFKVACCGIILILLTQCQKDKEFSNSCSLVIDDSNEICLQLEDLKFSEDQITQLVEKIKESMNRIQILLPSSQISIKVTHNPIYIIPEIGIGGFNPGSNEVILSITSEFENFDFVLENYLTLLLAHEIHHAIRRRSVGYGRTLLQAAVSEGLADQFAVEVARLDPPPWALALEVEELDFWIDQAKIIWNNNSYDHASWFFGTDDDIPRWAGYAIGYKLVQIYLKENTDMTAAALHDMPAEQFEIH